MKPSIVALSGFCLVFSGVVVLQHRSASAEQRALVAELNRTSNDWKQAILKLDEQGRLTYTLQTQLKLLQEEHLPATNELPKLKAALANLQSLHEAGTKNARATSNRLQFQILELTDERADRQQRFIQMAQQLRSAESQFERLSNQITTLEVQLKGTTNVLLSVEKEKIALEHQLRDPSFLSAQLERHRAAAKKITSTKAELEQETGRVALLPDGSVKQIP